MKLLRPRTLTALRRVAYFLLIGAIANIAIAWSLAAWLPQRNWAYFYVWGPSNSDPWVVFKCEFRGIGAVRRTWSLEAAGLDRMPPFMLAIDLQPYQPALDRRPTNQNTALRWGRFDNIRGDPQKSPMDGCEHATGWPFLSAWYELTVDDFAKGPRLIRQRGGIPIGSALHPGFISSVHDIRALPYRPIWVGSAANTIIYATVAWTLVAVAAWIRRQIRRTRGKCSACGYDLAGLPAPSLCPECGKPQ